MQLIAPTYWRAMIASPWPMAAALPEHQGGLGQEMRPGADVLAGRQDRRAPAGGEDGIKIDATWATWPKAPIPPTPFQLKKLLWAILPLTCFVFRQEVL